MVADFMGGLDSTVMGITVARASMDEVQAPADLRAAGSVEGSPRAEAAGSMVAAASMVVAASMVAGIGS
jgi:hypothetical protein